MPLFILIFLFIAVPIAEISLLFKVGAAIGGLNTILFVIFTAVLGAYLVRQQGFATLTKLQQEASSGRIPALQMAEGAALLFAGAVLLTPGFITDAIGFTLLIPFTRRAIITFLATRFANRSGTTFNYTNHTAHTNHSNNDDPSVIEGEFTDSKEDK